MKIGVLTAGGDCPGLNAALRSLVISAAADGHEVIGIRRGFEGLAQREMSALSSSEVGNIVSLGGTILGASSFDPFREDSIPAVAETIESEDLAAVIVIGGEHSMDVARRLHSEHGLPIIGIPKTIDNDVVGTDFTFGFDTAVQIATEAIDRLHTTAESHDRVMVVEVMGRNTGWIALWSAIAAGADAVLIPEVARTVPDLIETIKQLHRGGKDYSIVVVAEGAALNDSDGSSERVVISKGSDYYGYERLGGVGVELARHLDSGTGFEVRATVLGHIQRGGSPTAVDRVLATRLAATAYEAVTEGRYGTMAALRGSDTVIIPLEGTRGFKPANQELIEQATRLGLC